MLFARRMLTVQPVTTGVLEQNILLAPRIALESLRVSDLDKVRQSLSHVPHIARSHAMLPLSFFVSLSCISLSVTLFSLSVTLYLSVSHTISLSLPHDVTFA